MLDKFKHFQGDTAKLVLKHLLQKADTCDQSTMMGEDMFALERIALNARIEDL